VLAKCNFGPRDALQTTIATASVLSVNVSGLLLALALSEIRDRICREIPCLEAERMGAVGSQDDMARQVLCSRVGALILPPLETKTMLDVLFIVVTVAFFAISLAYTAGCERL
jgi:hypothetical protein